MEESEMLTRTDLTEIDLPTLQEMFRDLEEENSRMSMLLTENYNNLGILWSDLRKISHGCQTWGQYWEKKKQQKEIEEQI